LPLSISSNANYNEFLSSQKRYPRVRAAISEKEEVVSGFLEKSGFELNDINILFIAFKEEKQLIVFAKRKTEVTYKELTRYNICRISGKLGPKKKEGDFQVPEGFYFIDRFNPSSRFHLSLGVNYPNRADRIRSGTQNPGSDIFIHGSCATVGCLPMTDDKIKEIYLLAMYARNNGQLRIPVYIFPFEMTRRNFSNQSLKHRNDKDLLSFWSNLKVGFEKFDSEKRELKVTVNPEGKYLFRD